MGNPLKRKKLRKLELAKEIAAKKNEPRKVEEEVDNTVPSKNVVVNETNTLAQIQEQEQPVEPELEEQKNVEKQQTKSSKKKVLKIESEQE